MEKVFINEVGLRDGLQNQPGFIDTDGKRRLMSAILNTGVKEMEVSSFVNPKAVPQMADAAVLMSTLPDTDCRFTALTVNQKGYERAREHNVQSVAVVLASTETFNQRNIRMSLETATEVCSSIVAQAKRDGVFVRAYVSGAFGCPFEGAVSSDEIRRLVEGFAEADQVSIADTIGCANPAQVHTMMSLLVSEFGADRFNLHLHDTRGLAVANAWAGLEAGVRSFDASIGGLGGCPFAPGAAGNMATEDLMVLLNETGYESGLDRAAVLEAINVAEELVGYTLGGRSRRWLSQPSLGECNAS